MARFLALNFRAGHFRLALAVLGLLAFFSTVMRAEQPMATAPMTPAQPMATTPMASKSQATNAAPMIANPDAFNRYGKILMPGDEMAHPLKLKMPFPGIGEVKVPHQDELDMREKLEQLTKLSDTDIRAQLEQWPAYSKMTLRDEGTMLQRIQDFRDYRSHLAMQKAHDMGLLTLTPDQKARFEKEYWDKRLQMDHDLAKQFEPVFKAREQKLQDDLFREFSSMTMGPMAQVPKPPKPGVASNPPPASGSVAQVKAVGKTSPPAMAQAPR